MLAIKFQRKEDVLRVSDIKEEEKQQHLEELAAKYSKWKTKLDNKQKLQDLVDLRKAN